MMHAAMTSTTAQSPTVVAVRDMGASAIRLVVAEVGPKRKKRVLEELSRGVSLGRDTFSGGAIRSNTIEAAAASLDGFRRVMDSYGVHQVRAVATSAVREARNGDMFLDRIRGRTGIAFEIINEAEESRLVYLAVREEFGKADFFRSASPLLIEVGGGSTSLTQLRRGHPNRSGVYALGAVRMRQQLNLRAHSHEIQVSLLKRYIANVVAEIRVEIPLRQISHVVAIGGDIRFAAGELLEPGHPGPRELARDAFVAFCDEIERMTPERLVERFGLATSDADSVLPGLLVYKSLLLESQAERLFVSDASLRAGVLLDLAEPGGRLGMEEFQQVVLASAEALGQRYEFDRAHGRHVATLASQLFDALTEEHGLSSRDRLLLQVAGLLHDIGVFVSLRGHHKHAQYLLSSSQIFGLTDEENLMVSNIARYHRGAFPQQSHLPYIALDKQDRLIVNKLAALLRVANALDAEHLQKVERVQVARQRNVWVLQLDGKGDLTMEQMAASSRADLFADVFGHQLVIRRAGVVQ